MTAVGPNRDYFEDGAVAGSSELTISKLTAEQDLSDTAVKSLKQLVKDLEGSRCFAQNTQTICGRCREFGEPVCSALIETTRAIHPSNASADVIAMGSIADEPTIEMPVITGTDPSSSQVA